jgi:hypothetical protein
VIGVQNLELLLLPSYVNLEASLSLTSFIGKIGVMVVKTGERLMREMV